MLGSMQLAPPCRACAQARASPRSRGPRSGRGRRTRTSALAPAKEGPVGGLRSALSGEVNTSFQEGAAFLRDLGLENQAEIARILDIAMNPNSLFVSFHDRNRAVNGSARPLTVEEDMKPVVDFLRQKGLANKQVVNVLVQHPPVLSYDPETRLAPIVAYLEELGIEEPMEVLVERPSLLGLDVDGNLRKIVDWLQVHDYSHEDILQYLKTSI